MLLCVLTESYVINNSVDTDVPAVFVVLSFISVHPVTGT